MINGISHRHGSYLALIDWNENDAKKPIPDLGDNKDRVFFRKTDFPEWDDVLAAFEGAFDKFGVIDAVISNAGINAEALLAEEYDHTTGKLKRPNLKKIQINLIAHIFVALLQGIIDTPPLYQYCAAKHGLLGLMREFRSRVFDWNITINMVAPWMTVTPMLPESIKEIRGGLSQNSPAGIAQALILPLLNQSINGKTFFVAGNEVIELEDKLQETQGLCMGEPLNTNVIEGQRRLIPVGINPEKK
ncbi:hypothetical protein BKA66DRAFT_576396 [Pyrenochaeta sp. MPI-SDFR-AT-0127]|nr:hypothetical protein BKA66DRAFT_576396 [Pyrenochaeta sp. MPI-SDFR-AT-0127]